MVRQVMGDLVAEHGRQPAVVSRELQDAAEDEYLASGENEGVLRLYVASVRERMSRALVCIGSKKEQPGCGASLLGSSMTKISQFSSTMPLKGMSFLMTRFTRCVLYRASSCQYLVHADAISSPLSPFLQPTVPPERVPRVPVRQDSSSLSLYLVQYLLVLRLARLPHRVVAIAVESRAPADGYGLQVAEVEDKCADHGSNGYCVRARTPKDAPGRFPAEEWPCIADARIIRVVVGTSLRLRGRGSDMARGSALDGRGPEACRARSSRY